jgi:ABC-2 type transport system ATP-binding protein
MCSPASRETLRRNFRLSISVDVRDVSKRFRLVHDKYNSLKERVIHAGRVPHEDFWALQNISLQVNEGETVGLLGHNGSGKSTLLKCIAGILQPTTGEIAVKGRVASMLELGAGFSDDLSGRANIFLNASLMGMSKKEIESKIDDIIDFAEIGPFIDNQVRFYSSGMYTRLGFAVAVNMDPHILLVDEVLAVGDENFQRKCIDKIRSFQKEGRTIVFVSHSPDLVRSICDRAYVLDHGKIVGQGNVQDAISILRDFQMAGSSLVNDPSDPANAKKPKPSDHHNSGEKRVLISSLEIQGESTGGSAPLQSGDSAILRVGYEVLNYVPTDVIFGLEILDAKGETVYRGDTATLEMPPLTLVGKGNILVRLGSLPLGEGVYSVSVSLVDLHGGTLLDWRSLDNSVKVLCQQKSSGVLALNFTTFVEQTI